MFEKTRPMIWCLRFIPLALLPCLSSGAIRTSAPSTERFTIFLTGEPIGHLNVVRSGDEVTIDYLVSQNGRGPRHTENVTLADDAFPVDWTIEGRSSNGAAVSEHFTLEGDRASWATLNDSGSSRTSKKPLYVASDASPWALGMYVRALLKSPGMRRNVLPIGELRAERLREIALGDGPNPEHATVYVLWGVSSTPVFIMLDSSNSLIACFGSSDMIVADRLKTQASSLSRLSADLMTDYLRQMSKALTHRSTQPIYIQHARVFDSIRGELSEPQSVVLYKDRIASIRRDSTPPSNATIIEANGDTILPGLFDAHTHLGSDWMTALHIAAGVTSVRDMGSDNQELLRLIDRIHDGQVIGPRTTLSGFIEGRSQFSARNGFIVDNLQSGLNATHWYADHGYYAIKLYSSIVPDWVTPLASEAHRLHLKVMGHVPAFMSSERAVRDGYDEVTHINQLVLSFVIDPERDDTRTPFRFIALAERLGSLDLNRADVRGMIALMKSRGTALDSTIAVFENFLLSRPGIPSPTDAPWLSHMPSAVQRQRMKPQLPMRPEQDGAYRASWSKLLQVLKLLYEEGIAIVPGTDEIAGFMLHSELEAYGKAGIPNARVLQIATIETARHLGVDQSLGSVERGKLADLILVSGDPTRNLSDIRQIRMVIKNGEIYFPEEIYRAMQIKPFATKPKMTIPLSHH